MKSELVELYLSEGQEGLVAWFSVQSSHKIWIRYRLSSSFSKLHFSVFLFLFHSIQIWIESYFHTMGRVSMAWVCSFSSLGSKYIHSNSINFVAVIVHSFVRATLVLSVGRLGVGTGNVGFEWRFHNHQFCLETKTHYWAYLSIQIEVKTEQNDANVSVLRKTILRDHKKRISSTTIVLLSLSLLLWQAMIFNTWKDKRGCLSASDGTSLQSFIPEIGICPNWVRCWCGLIYVASSTSSISSSDSSSWNKRNCIF